MAGRASRNNILAGFFLLLSIVAFVTVVIILSSLGDALSAKKNYVIGFSLIDGAEGLEPGAPVKLGGKRVGRVTNSALVFKPGTQEPTGVDVKIEVRADVVLFEDAVVQLAKPLLGANSSVNIVAISGLKEYDPDYAGSSAMLVEGGRLVGRLGGPGFLSQQDYQKIQNVIARVDRATAQIEPQIKPIMDDARASVANVRSITDDASQRWPKWGDRLDQVFADADPIVKNIKDAAADARAFIASAQKTIDDNRKSIDEIVENVRELTAKAKGEGYTEVLAAVRRGREGLDSFASAARRVDELLVTETPKLRDLIASGNLASQQLKLLTTEVRAAPWRLLYQPTKKEHENELLYNSVRAYSMAVADLYQASQSLEAVAQRAQADQAAGQSAAPGIDSAAAAELSRKVQEAFDRYEREEKAFLDRWIRQGEDPKTR